MFMKKLRKKMLFFTILLFFLGFIFSYGEQGPAEEITLTFCYWGSPAENDAITKALKAFEEAHPGITAEPMYIPGDIIGVEYAAKMRALSQAGQLPDCGYFRPEQFGEFADVGMFLDLTERVDKENLREAYLPQVWLDVNGKIFGSYTAAECQVMFYNKDVLEKAGVPLPPTDYTKGWK
jgi:multiple sugar transport system substrate-binding protein